MKHLSLCNQPTDRPTDKITYKVTWTKYFGHLSYHWFLYLNNNNVTVITFDSFDNVNANNLIDCWLSNISHNMTLIDNSGMTGFLHNPVKDLELATLKRTLTRNKRISRSGRRRKRRGRRRRKVSSIFSRVHATLYLTMSVGRSVRNHFSFLGV